MKRIIPTMCTAIYLLLNRMHPAILTKVARGILNNADSCQPTLPVSP
jgi:hypothetical protein